jgi:23S rRNA (guanine745-N1)-methyltransferase
MVTMYPSAVQALLCPVCADSFDVPAAGAAALACRSGHSFDIAKQGYVNLLTGAGTHFTADTAHMVEARAGFLAAGHYRPLAEALASVVAGQLSDAQRRPPAGAGGPRATDVLVDAGTGTGYYLEQIHRRAAVASVGVDISKYALRRAARTNPQTVNLAWDVWQPLPLAAGSAVAVVVVFAPRNAAEFARILQPEGFLAVVTPLPGHLAEIAEAAGLLAQQEHKLEALEGSLEQFFRLSSSQQLEYRLELGREDVVRAAMMGPSGHHLDPAVLRNSVAALPETSMVSARFQISVFHKLA